MADYYTLFSCYLPLGRAEHIEPALAIHRAMQAEKDGQGETLGFELTASGPKANIAAREIALVAGEVPANGQGVVTKTLPGGRCARVRHLGSHQRIGESIYALYRDWLPGSGEELRDFPLFFHYLNLLPDTPEAALVTDIYLPLKSLPT